MLSTDFTDYTDRESTLAGDARGELGIGQMAPRADFRHGRKPPSAGSCGGWVGAQSVESVKSVAKPFFWDLPGFQGKKSHDREHRDRRGKQARGG